MASDVTSMSSGYRDFMREWPGGAPIGGTPGRASLCKDAGAPPALPTAVEAGGCGLVGRSAVLRTVLAHAKKVAPTDSTVLITGETGTGKELLARAIHNWSRRAARPFVSVNCAAIPHSLIASELFGHERGAFTGALQRRQGRFELASGGTLFLDEVGELPAETQVALLRVLQEREFERVGSSTPVRADVRIVAATNRDLERAIADGTFRSDLYYRLNVFPLEMPPLRARTGDIRLLVEHFATCCGWRTGKTFRGIDPATLERLEAYPWPGNVRELQNIVERSLIIRESEVFSVDERWLSVGASCGEAASPHASPGGVGLRTAAARDAARVPRDDARCDPARGHPRSAARVQLGDRRSSRRRRAAGTQANHPPGAHAEARNHAAAAHAAHAAER